MTFRLEGFARGALFAAWLVLAMGCHHKSAVPFAPFEQPPSDGGGQGNPGGDGGSAAGGNPGTASTASPEELAAQLMEWGGGLDDPDKLCAGQGHTCVIDKQGGVHCWGDTGDAPAGLPPMVQVVCGDNHSCALAMDGSVSCWGAGADPAKVAMAKASPGNTTLFLEQGQSIPPSKKFKQISAGGVHTCGIDENDEIACWGGGDKEKMNDQQPNFGQSLAPMGKFSQVSAGQVHTCAVALTGEVACWGAGATSATCFPPQDYDCGQAAAAPGKFLQVASGDMHTCALAVDGTLKCWGRGTGNDNCDVLSGTNAYDCGQASPPSSMMPFVKVRSGWEFNCAITEDYAMQCWGWNSYKMAVVPPKEKYTQMSLGDTHACGLTLKGKYQCWGTASGGASVVPPGVP